MGKMMYVLAGFVLGAIAVLLSAYCTTIVADSPRVEYTCEKQSYENSEACNGTCPGNQICHIKRDASCHCDKPQ